jgi:hypothetical protein
MIRAKLFACCAAALCGCASIPSRSASTGPDQEVLELARELEQLERRVPELPVRRTQPMAAHAIDPRERSPATYTDATALLSKIGADGSEERWRLVRTADRLNIRKEGDDGPGSVEWLFIRNPVDPAQFTGWLIDHDLRLAIEHDYSTLAGSGIARSWLTLACMGLHPHDMGLAEDAAGRSAFGIAFHRMRPRDPKAAEGVSEIWWSEQHQLALEIRGRGEGGEWRQTTLTLELAADPECLRDVHARLPEYRIRDLADFQEDAHRILHGAGGHG